MRFTAYFLLVAVLAGVVGYFGYSGVQVVFESFDVIADETAPEIGSLGTIKARAERMRAEALSFALINSEVKAATEEIEKFEETNKELDEVIAELEEIEESDEQHEEDEQELVENIKKTKAELYNAALALVNAKKEGKSGQEILDLEEELEEAEERFRAVVKTGLDLEIEELGERDEAADKLVANTTRLILIVSIITIILSILLGLFVSRRITKPLADLSTSNKLISEGKFEEAQQQRNLPTEIKELMETRTSMLKGLVGKQNIEDMNKQLLQATKELQKKKAFDEKKRKATLSILEDIDEQKKIIEKSNEELYVAALYPQMNPGLVLKITMAGMIEDMNPTTKKLFGKVAHNSFFNLTTVDQKKVMRELKQTGVSQQEALIREKYYNLTFRLDSKTQLIYVYGLDISKRIIAEKKADAAYQELKQLDTLKSVFLSMTSHELKTPITPIKMQAESLLSGIQGKLNKNQKESIEMILRNINHLHDLLNDVLDSAKLEAHRLRMNPEKTNINQMIGEVIKDVKQMAHEKNLSVSSNIPRLPLVTLDKNRFKQVVLNLVHNSLKFTPSGGKITLSAKQDKKHIKITVTDTGIGIPKNMISKIFDKFVQATPAYRLKEKGTGLGLTISKGIVSQFGGKIWAESKGKNKGASFHFTIPLKDRKINKQKKG